MKGSVPISIVNAYQGDNTTFSPNSVKLVIGVNNTVTFVNSGKETVGVVSESWPTSGRGFQGPMLFSCGTYVVTLTAPGIYTYTDYLHEASLGTIVVTA